ncbi:hypothetical protein [Paenibacillus sp. Y412MC10]|uniref:hypothetical protein n=1 Tax=Geobacillus sp. (strain Y412MC10) TaxID=481743 RepID=UPI0011A64D56|nr:hypothetical protein [Paenibacillus sp. Y412MC10]
MTTNTGDKVYILQFSKLVRYWNNENGAEMKKDGTKDADMWHVSVDGLNGRIKEENRPFAEQLAEYLLDNLGYKSNYLSITENGHVSFNMIENGDGEPVEPGQDMGTQLYLCDYDCCIKVAYEAIPSRESLAELLPNAEQ